MSLKDITDATGISKPKLGHMEAGRYRQQSDDIRTVLTACGSNQDDIKRLIHLAREGDDKTWWAPWSNVISDWTKLYLGLEGFARSVFVFEPIVLPGLLQLPEYAEQIIGASVVVRPDHVTRLADLRRTRAARLADNEPIEVHAVIGEPGLRLQIADGDIRNSQLKRLLKLAKQPNVTIQVLSLEKGPYAALNAGRFDLFSFEDADSVAYSERLDDAAYVTDLDKIGTYKVVIDDLKQVAMSPAESSRTIRSLVS